MNTLMQVLIICGIGVILGIYFDNVKALNVVIPKSESKKKKHVERVC